MTKTLSRKQAAELLNLKEYHISYIPQIYPDFPKYKRFGNQKLFIEQDILDFIERNKGHDYASKIMKYVARYQQKLQRANAIAYFGTGIDEQVMQFIRSKSINTLRKENEYIQ